MLTPFKPEILDSALLLQVLLQLLAVLSRPLRPFGFMEFLGFITAFRLREFGGEHWGSTRWKIGLAHRLKLGCLENSLFCNLLAKLSSLLRTAEGQIMKCLNQLLVERLLLGCRKLLTVDVQPLVVTRVCRPMQFQRLKAKTTVTEAIASGTAMTKKSPST